MYEALKGWVVSIVVVIILLSLMDMILPEGGLRKYARLATGLIVIAVILKPVFVLFGNGDSIEAAVRKYTALQNSSQQHIQQYSSNPNNNKLTADTMDRFRNNLKDAIEKEIRLSLNYNYEVQRIEVIDDSSNDRYLAVKKITLKENNKGKHSDTVKEVSIHIMDAKEQQTVDQGDWNSKVATLLQQKFGIDKSSIKFVR